MHASAAELGELYEGIIAEKTPDEERLKLARKRQQEFSDRHGEELLEAQARHAHLQPSVEAVARILRPEIAAQTTWVSETSFLRAMLVQPKASSEDLGTVRQGLGHPAPPRPSSRASHHQWPERGLVPLSGPDYIRFRAMKGEEKCATCRAFREWS
jgi:hypothetical protein